MLVEVDSIGVTNAVSRLNHGIDIGGQPIGEPTAFHTGVRVSPSSLDLDEEVRRYRYKVEAGAEFAVTRAGLRRRRRGAFPGPDAREVDLPLVVTIRTLGSLREAEWLANEVPGQRVPQALVERMRQAAAAGHGGRRKAWPSRRNWSRRCGPSRRGSWSRGRGLTSFSR